MFSSKLLPVALLTLVNFHNTLSYPFLYGPTHAITTLLGASSGNVYPTHGNIEDLRATPKHSHEAQVVEPSPPDEPHENENSNGHDDDEDFNFSDEDLNKPEPEVNTTLLQKKIMAILRKLMVLRQLHSSLTQGSGYPREKPKVEVKLNNDDVDDVEDSEDDLDSILNKSEGLTQDATITSSSNKVDLSSSNPGVYIMELVGTLVGLTVGAIDQLNHFHTSTTTTEASN